MKTEGLEVIPSAKRLITSLRDMGYDFSQAVADVVDNSIEAKASRVDIDVEFDGDDSWVRISDNGHGMRPDVLREAMRYGAERAYDVEDLGKFGLGLKTASMSQCQHLSVASRWNRDRADIAGYSWDLDHVERTNRWEILPVSRDRLGPAIRGPLKDTVGTVVLWQRLDRVLGYKHPYGESARKRLSQMCRELEAHLGMVFHRFLGGEVGRKRLRILLNGNEVKAWDPFCRIQPKTRALQPIRLTHEHEGASGDILIEPHVLPHQDDFEPSSAFNEASGPANWNQQQGFYIYRAGRMIQSGGWCQLRTADEHTKLARIAVSFVPVLDDAFKINVAKMRVHMPQQIRDFLRQAIGPAVKLGREVYVRKPGTSPSATARAPHSNILPASRTSHTLSMVSASKKAASNVVSGDSKVLTFEEWAERVMAAATAVERPIIEAVIARVRSGVTRG